MDPDSSDVTQKLPPGLIFHEDSESARYCPALTVCNATALHRFPSEHLLLLRQPLLRYLADLCIGARWLQPAPQLQILLVGPDPPLQVRAGLRGLCKLRA